MKRNEAIELLEEYNKLLMDECYTDSDILCERPTAIDKFLLTYWAKENLPIIKQSNNQFGNNDNTQNQFPK